jgi:hypothetical protein
MVAETAALAAGLPGGEYLVCAGVAFDISKKQIRKNKLARIVINFRF